jgi:hypothetical protein
MDIATLLALAGTSIVKDHAIARLNRGFGTQAKTRRLDCDDGAEADTTLLAESRVD